MKKIVVSSLLLSLAIFVNACSMFSRDNLPKPSPLVKFKATKNVTALWQTHPNRSSKQELLKLQPMLNKGVIYAADNRGKITATRARDGKLLWQTQTGAPITAGPAVAHGLVVVGTGDARVLAFRQANGVKRWQANVSNEILAAPTIFADKVIVKSIDGQLQALAARNGHALWNYRHPIPNLILRSSSSVRVANNKVISGFADGKVVALSLATGDVVWKHSVALPSGATEVDRMVDVDADPIIHNGKIFIATYQGYLATLDLETGAELWRHKVSTFNNIAYHRQLIFVTDAKSDVWAFRASDGGVQWHQTKLAARGLTAPTAVGNMIVVGDREGYLHYLAQKDGHLAARIFVNRSGIIAAPLAQGHRLYVLANNGKLAAFRI